MGSPVVGSISSHREHPPVFRARYLQLLKAPTVVRSIERTYSCLEYQQFSRAPPVVRSTYGCREHLQLSNSWSISRVPRVVERTSNSRKYLHLPGAVIRSTSSCRGDLHHSEVSPLARSTCSCPKYLQLSSAPTVVQSTSSCRE